MDHFENETDLENFQNIQCMSFVNHIQVYDFFSKGKGLLFIHFNIRSYSKNIDAALVLLQSLKIEFDCIAFTEAWTDDLKTLTQIDGYDLFNTDNNWNRNDGVIVYLKTELCGTMQQIRLGEATGLRLDFTLDLKHYSILTIYRSPSMETNLFLNDLETYYTTMNNNSKTHIFMGDINIDILPETKDTNLKELYLNIMYSAGFIEVINKPTREVNNSKTCIDHIFAKHRDFNKLSSCVLETDITDHYTVIAKIELGNDNTTSGTHNMYLDSDVLSGLMAGQSWDHVLAHQDVNKCCD